MDQKQIVVWIQLVPVAVVSAILGALVGALINHRLTLSREKKKTNATLQQHLAALTAEIEYCGKLAATYGGENIIAPLYRFPRTVHDTVYSTLVSSILTGDDVTALTTFYSQVDQMNRGLDAVDRHRTANELELIQDEFKRLRAKASEMSHPTEALNRPAQSSFYVAANEAVNRHRKIAHDNNKKAAHPRRP